MNRNFLITRPNYDNTTFYLFKWSEKCLQIADEKGIEYNDLNSEKANRKNIEKVLKTKNPGLVLFNGHGNNDKIYGNKQEILIEAGTNEVLLNGKIVHSISCSSAKELGPKCIKSGTISFIGYEDDFVFVFDKNKTFTPLKDDVASNFLEPPNELAISILKGNSVDESYKRSQDMFKKKISKLLTTEAPIGSENVILWLVWDMSKQVCLGDKGARF